MKLKEYAVYYEEGKTKKFVEAFTTRAEAETFIGIEGTQMEMAEAEGKLVIETSMDMKGWKCSDVPGVYVK
jgi:hypothetical protein